MKLELLKKTSWGRACFRTLEPVVSGAIVVKGGFETDLASVPRVAWWFINPVDYDVAPCAVVHDFMCREAKDWKQRKYADSVFYTCLRKRGLGWKAPLMWLAVRLGACWWMLRK